MRELSSISLIFGVIHEYTGKRMKLSSLVLPVLLLMSCFIVKGLTSLTPTSAENGQFLGSQYLSVESNGPVQLGLTDSQENRTGYDPQTGQASVQIPQSTYSGVGSDPQLVMVELAQGEYLIEIYPEANGNFTLKIENSALAQVHRYTVSSNARLNETMDYWVRIVSDGSFKVFDCSSDPNNDYVIDIYDALILAGAFSTRLGEASWRENVDINNDGVVDIFDALILAGNFGQKWIEYQTIEKGYFSGLTSPEYYVIRNQEDWTSLWNLHQSTRSPQYPPPQVNFSESVVIAVCMGERGTGGYEIEIRSIMPANGTLKIEVEQISPGPHCILVQVFTQPYHFVKLDITDRQVVFHTTYTMHDCV